MALKALHGLLWLTYIVFEPSPIQKGQNAVVMAFMYILILWNYIVRMFFGFSFVFF